MACNGRGPARTCGPINRSSSSGSSQELGNRNSATQDAEPPGRHLDRVLLSAFGTWRCPLLGLLLDMGTPGRCRSRALAGGFRLLEFKGHFQSGLEPFVGAGLVGCPGPGEILTPQPHHYSCPALQPGSALLLTRKRELILCLDSLHSPRTPYTRWAFQASEGCCCLLCGPTRAERRGGRYPEVTGRYTHCGFLFRQSTDFLVSCTE